MAYYQKLEDAVRICVHKLQGAIDEFEEEIRAKRERENQHFEKDDKGLIKDLNEEELKRYRNLLEDRNRLAIDIAIAAHHCGSRYMGDVMTAYYQYAGADATEAVLENETVKGHLRELLATKRNKIAKKLAQQYAGAGNDTHGYTSYMQNMGELLALPGAESIVEHLTGSRFNRDEQLRLFFEAYTVDRIIQTVQKEMARSENFRNRVIDWLKSKMGDWNPPSEDKVNAILQRANSILNSASSSSSSNQPQNLGQIFHELLEHLKGLELELPERSGSWKHWLVRVTNLPQSKQWLKEKELAASKLWNLTEPGYKNRDSAGSSSQDEEVYKISALRKLLNDNGVGGISEETLQRVVKEETTFEEALRGGLDGDRAQVFLESIEFKGNDLSPEMIEWLLIDQGVLHPQELDSIDLDLSDTSQAAPGSQNDLRVRTYSETIKALGENTGSGAVDDASSLKRYRFEVGSSQQAKKLHSVFSRSFAADAERVISATEDFSGRQLYSRWGKTCKVDAPGAAAKLLKHRVVKAVTVLALTAFAWKKGNRAYAATPQFIAAKVVPYVINHTPIQVIRVGNHVLNGLDYVKNHRLGILAIGWLAQAALRRIPVIGERVNSISWLSVLFPSSETKFWFFANRAVELAKGTWNVMGATGNLLERYSKWQEKIRLQSCRTQASLIWKNTFVKQSAVA